MQGGRRYIAHIKDYCANCTLAGFSYIANANLHVIERIFWVICVIISAFGSYLLISQYQRDFDSSAVSIVYESLPSTQKVAFPTIAVCDSYNKYEAPQALIDFVEALDGPDAEEYSYEVETFISFLIYPYIYREGNIKSWCKSQCCTECPSENLRALHHRFKANCSNFFEYCEFSLKPFDCCKYFLPLLTPHGNCFMLNSLLNNKKGSPTWFNNEINPMTDTGKIKIVTKMPTQVSVMNEEDIPHDTLPGNKIEATKAGQDKTLQIFMQSMINDPDVRDIPPEFRQCRFPDELLPESSFRAYSFSSCFFDCLREHQMRECNCSMFSLMPEGNAKFRDCDMEGFLCLEKLILVRPDGKNLLPWAETKYPCECLPSCTESDFKVVFDSQQKINASNPYLTISITMPEFATERYRRQALRTRLDVVVTIGGILGLFLGASILSGIEFLYYFTLRLWNDYRMERRQQQQQQQPSTNGQ